MNRDKNAHQRTDETLFSISNVFSASLFLTSSFIDDEGEKFDSLRASSSSVDSFANASSLRNSSEGSESGSNSISLMNCSSDGYSLEGAGSEQDDIRSSSESDKPIIDFDTVQDQMDEMEHLRNRIRELQQKQQLLSRSGSDFNKDEEELISNLLDQLYLQLEQLQTIHLPDQTIHIPARFLILTKEEQEDFKRDQLRKYEEQMIENEKIRNERNAQQTKITPSTPFVPSEDSPYSIQRPAHIDHANKSVRRLAAFFDIAYITNMKEETELQQQVFIKQLGNIVMPFESLSLGSLIGEGAFAKVYEGLYSSQKVAVKQLKTDKFNNDKIFSSFYKESTVFKNIAPHKNILKFLGCTTEPLAIVTEFMEGGSLHSQIHENKNRLTMRQILSIAKSVTMGMKHLHGTKPCSIIHRDLTSHNILLRTKINSFGAADTCHDVDAVIGDFGISRMKEKKGPQKMSAIGNARWVAPEIVRKEAYTKKADVYSFGMVLYEMSTNKIPFDEILNETEVVHLIGEGKTPYLPDYIAPALRSIITKCWSTIPKKRPSFKELTKIIEKLQLRLTPSELESSGKMSRYLELSASEEELFKKIQMERYKQQLEENKHLRVEKEQWQSKHALNQEIIQRRNRLVT